MAPFPLLPQQPLRVAVMKLCLSRCLLCTCPSIPNTFQPPTGSFLRAGTVLFLAVTQGLALWPGAFWPLPKGRIAGRGHRPAGGWMHEPVQWTGLLFRTRGGGGGATEGEVRVSPIAGGSCRSQPTRPLSRPRSPCPPSQVISNLLHLTPQQQTTLALSLRRKEVEPDLSRRLQQLPEGGGGEGLRVPDLGGSLSFREWKPWGPWRVPKRLGKPSLGSLDPPRAKGGGAEGVASMSVCFRLCPSVGLECPRTLLSPPPSHPPFLEP